ncbi:type II toxin-antitoxin system HicA family toxin [Lactobacillus sp. PV037]|uniref:type II toxin-antitoxin system HicA family toxin n=1 Tax=Lactobacillus sp. PV037 TaxID=2594496 RepID=UPI00223FFCA1|nr:type II toxin-antitoxin system HicA family toxin [Lactobacillus sp. PV037]QNQ83653.1 type II toxin-antitoxin system HicA family toxin [Lactobacillus sp. PV037]
MESRKVIKRLKREGWFLARITGDHHHFKHPTKKGIVTVPHPNKDIPKGTLDSIYKQAGWK